MLAHHKYGVGCGVLRRRVIAYHADHLVGLLYVYAPYSGCGTAQRPCVILVETHAASVASGKKDLAPAIGHRSLKQLVPVPHGNCIDTVGTRP